MSRFRHRPNEVPGLNLAAMPDLIFTVLFFFMIVTHMRDVKPMVRYDIPQGTEVEKTIRKGSMVYIFIGKPIDGNGQVIGQESRIQVNDHYVRIDEIGREINHARAQMSEENRQHLVVSIRANRDTEMGLINDVKQELRKAGALSINYSATKKNHK